VVFVGILDVRKELSVPSPLTLSLAHDLSAVAQDERKGGSNVLIRLEDESDGALAVRSDP
jgi:hypothetical protein